MRDDSCPREAILPALFSLIEVWRQKGIRSLLMGDFIIDFSHCKVKAKFENIGMREIFGTYHETSPNTFYRRTQPIDSIFVTSNICPDRCGYTAFDWGMYLDHCLLWMDINSKVIFGSLHPSWIPRARRLKLVDPRIVKKFLSLRTAMLRNSSLPDRVSKL